ncbi:MAG TPA: DMT family transporter [Burkholderiales bacterium]|jgi:drug/metabolite transporter (DMT)-like permease
MQNNPPPATVSAAPAAPVSSAARFPSSFLVWYFVIVWGSGYLATKAGLQYAAPFTFLTLRFTFGLICAALWAFVARPPLPRNARELAHIAMAGLLMHAFNLGGSHYAQYLHMSAGVTALILALQPLLTALIVWRFSQEKMRRNQWAGIALGLLGVSLVVWHKIDLHAITPGALTAVGVSLVAITTGTLYQRKFCPHVDLRSAALIQFSACILLTAPLAWTVEGFVIHWAWQMVAAIVFLVIFGSILAVNALHTLMRRGAATRVTSLLYLTPIIAVALELMLFGVVPDPLMIVGMVIACCGVALVNR